jgi:hypothetical protein
MIHRNLLDNAIISIRIGVEDFETGKEERIISAVRNLYAGLLLLFKEKLLRLSPADTDEALVKARIVPKKAKDGSVVFVGSGKNTVDVQQIKDRFKQLDVSNGDWKRFDRITELRNNIEHYYTTLTYRTAQEIISNSFIIIRDFVRKELDEEPLDLLGKDCWNTMLQQSDVFESEKEDCLSILRELAWDSPILEELIEELRCSSCGSSLIEPTDQNIDSLYDEQFKCRACGSSLYFSDITENALHDSFGYEIHRAFIDGGVVPIEQCYRCGRHSYVLEESKCVICGFELGEQECWICGETLTNYDDLDRRLCSYHAYVADKDD